MIQRLGAIKNQIGNIRNKITVKPVKLATGLGVLTGCFIMGLQVHRSMEQEEMRDGIKVIHTKSDDSGNIADLLALFPWRSMSRMYYFVFQNLFKKMGQT